MSHRIYLRASGATVVSILRGFQPGADNFGSASNPECRGSRPVLDLHGVPRLKQQSEFNLTNILQRTTKLTKQSCYRCSVCWTLNLIMSWICIAPSWIPEPCQSFENSSTRVHLALLMLSLHISLFFCDVNLKNTGTDTHMVLISQVNRDGASVLLHVHGFRPYFYAAKPPGEVGWGVAMAVSLKLEYPKMAACPSTHTHTHQTSPCILTA